MPGFESLLQSIDLRDIVDDKLDVSRWTPAFGHFVAQLENLGNLVHAHWHAIENLRGDTNYE